MSTSVEFGFGTVQYISSVAEVPPSTKVDGNVTINNSGSPGSPEHFVVTFMLTYKPGAESPARSNIFHWSEVVTGLDASTPYSRVEAAAARQIAPSLRAVADRIDAMVAEFDAKNAEHLADPQ